MKSFFLKFYEVLVAVIVAILFYCFSIWFEKDFYSDLQTWLKLYRSRLKEDGLTSSQVDSIISSSEKSTITAFESINDLYVGIIVFLIILAVLAFIRVLKLEKEIDSLKKKL